MRPGRPPRPGAVPGRRDRPRARREEFWGGELGLRCDHRHASEHSRDPEALKNRALQAMALQYRTDVSAATVDVQLGREDALSMPQRARHVIASRSVCGQPTTSSSAGASGVGQNKPPIRTRRRTNGQFRPNSRAAPSAPAAPPGIVMRVPSSATGACVSA